MFVSALQTLLTRVLCIQTKSLSLLVGILAMAVLSCHGDFLGLLQIRFRLFTFRGVDRSDVVNTSTVQRCRFWYVQIGT